LPIAIAEYVANIKHFGKDSITNKRGREGEREMAKRIDRVEQKKKEKNNNIHPGDKD